MQRIRVNGMLAVVVGLAVSCGSGPSSPQGGGSPSPSSPSPAPSARVLVVTHTTGFRHDSIPTAEGVLRDIGSERGYQVEFVRTADDVRQRLTAAALAPIDAVFFANTTGNLGIPDLPAFLSWAASGKAVLGAHSATDTYHDEPAFLAMLGGEFLAHGAIAEADVRVDDPSHPAVAHLGARFQITDELYRFTRNSRNDVRVLLSMDRNPPDGLGTAGEAADLPLAWHRSHGSGRVFYTALGHRSEVWQDARFRQHLREALRWAIGR